MATNSEPLEIRFWRKVRKTKTCWFWTGSTLGRRNHRQGHMHRCRRNGKSITDYVHRISWELHNGAIPKGMCVLHSCDNGLCVNPDHLFLGTQLDNMRDMDAKGRRKVPIGEQHSGTNLTDTQVIGIRLANGKLPQDVIASIAGTSRATVSGILRGVIWKHLL